MARRIAAEGTWRRILTDPASGAVLDYGTTRYVPPQHLSDHVIARDVTCRFPTCSWTAEACQLDHTIPFETDGAGGPTADHNLGAFHHRHHNDKTHHGFEVSQPEPGRFVITTPAGLTYHVDPEAVGPILDLHTADVREASPPTSRPRPPNDGDLPF
ncbi:MAG TPA: HNH endonuclease signature motif containing protein [Jiangellaceae bacterium]